MTDTVSITGLTIYPIKSCGGIALDESLCLEHGLQNDRAWALTDLSCKLLTQRDDPRLALIKPGLTAEADLMLSAAGHSPFLVQPTQGDTHRLKLNIWGDDRDAVDAGAGAAAWISEFLGYKCRLVRRLGTLSQSTLSGEPAGTSSSLLFADCCPILVMAEESLSDLNNRLPNPVGMDRFRPSMVISGLKSYNEDNLSTLRGTSIVLTATKRCARCLIVNIDQTTGTKELEPLHTLAQYRTVDGKVMVGCYFKVTTTGFVSLDDTLSCEFKADSI